MRYLLTTIALCVVAGLGAVTGALLSEKQNPYTKTRSPVLTQTVKSDQTNDSCPDPNKSADPDAALLQLFAQLFDEDLNGQSQQYKEDVRKIILFQSKGWRYPERPVQVRRTVIEKENRIIWAAGSTYVTTWGMFVIQNGKIINLSLIRENGACDGEPFGTCCGSYPVNESDHLEENESQRKEIVEILYRLFPDKTEFNQTMPPFRYNDFPTAEQQPHLKKMTLSCFRFSDGYANYFRQFPELEELYVRDAYVDNRSQLSALPYVKTLTLDNVAPIWNTPASWSNKIFGGEKNKNKREGEKRENDCRLESLTVKNFFSNNNDSTFWLDLAALSRLKTLTCFMRWQDFPALVHSTQLKNISVTINPHIPTNLPLTLENMPQLEELSISFCVPREVTNALKLQSEARPYVFLRLNRLPKLKKLAIIPSAVPSSLCEVTIQLGNAPMLQTTDMLLTYYRFDLPEPETVPQWIRDLSASSQWIAGRMAGSGFANSSPQIHPISSQSDIDSLKRNPKVVTDRDMQSFFITQEGLKASAERPLDFSVQKRASSFQAPPCPQAQQARLILPELSGYNFSWLGLPITKELKEALAKRKSQGVLTFGSSAVTPELLEILGSCTRQSKIVLNDVTPTDAQMFSRFLSDTSRPKSEKKALLLADNVAIDFTPEAAERFKNEVLQFGPHPRMANLSLYAPSPGITVSLEKHRYASLILHNIGVNDQTRINADRVNISGYINKRQLKTLLDSIEQCNELGINVEKADRLDFLELLKGRNFPRLRVTIRRQAWELLPREEKSVIAFDDLRGIKSLSLIVESSDAVARLNKFDPDFSYYGIGLTGDSPVPKVAQRYTWPDMRSTPILPPDTDSSQDTHSANEKIDERYYLITRGVSKQDCLTQVPYSGNETVLNALSHVDLTEELSQTDVWIMRSSNGEPDQKIPVNITDQKNAPLLLPGDRIFIVRKQ